MLPAHAPAGDLSVPRFLCFDLGMAVAKGG
jgi:hypothetical protein